MVLHCPSRRHRIALALVLRASAASWSVELAVRHSLISGSFKVNHDSRCLSSSAYQVARPLLSLSQIWTRCGLMVIS
jgi:hypothetical protein